MKLIQRLEYIRKERRAILKAIKAEVEPIYLKYEKALEANKTREDFLLAEIEKERESNDDS